MFEFVQEYLVDRGLSLDVGAGEKLFGFWYSEEDFVKMQGFLKRHVGSGGVDDDGRDVVRFAIHENQRGEYGDTVLMQYARWSGGPYIYVCSNEICKEKGAEGARERLQYKMKVEKDLFKNVNEVDAGVRYRVVHGQFVHLVKEY